MTEKRMTEQNGEKVKSTAEQSADRETEKKEAAGSRSGAVRILSLFLVILICCLLLLTLFTAVFGGPGSEKLLMILIVMDVIIPVILYGYLHFIRGMKR